MENTLTDSERIAVLERTIDRQRARIEHLEELHMMQALPPFFMLYIVDFDGPKDLVVPEGNGKPVWHVLR